MHFLEFFYNIFLVKPVESFALIISCIGGAFGLYQWRKGNIIKRAEIMKKLISQIREDKEIASSIELIDWGDGFEYDGKFHFKNEKAKEILIDEHNLFCSIDKTLSFFNYICYLRSLHIFKRKDLNIFDYNIRRLFDNTDICNYLHSLALWSNYLNISCSYEQLIKYGKKRGFVSKDFGTKRKSRYECFLCIEE